MNYTANPCANVCVRVCLLPFLTSTFQYGLVCKPTGTQYGREMSVWARVCECCVCKYTNELNCSDASYTSHWQQYENKTIMLKMNESTQMSACIEPFFSFHTFLPNFSYLRNFNLFGIHLFFFFCQFARSASPLLQHKLWVFCEFQFESRSFHSIISKQCETTCDRMTLINFERIDDGCEKDEVHSSLSVCMCERENGRIFFKCPKTKWILGHKRDRENGDEAQRDREKNRTEKSLQLITTLWKKRRCVLVLVL